MKLNNFNNFYTPCMEFLWCYLFSKTRGDDHGPFAEIISKINLIVSGLALDSNAFFWTRKIENIIQLLRNREKSSTLWEPHRIKRKDEIKRTEREKERKKKKPRVKCRVLTLHKCTELLGTNDSLIYSLIYSLNEWIHSSRSSDSSLAMSTERHEALMSNCFNLRASYAR